MASQGALIRAIDYNTVQSNINKILGLGVVDFGYGQSLYSSQVSTGDTVQAQDWAKLKLDMLAIASHQGTQSNPLITALPTVTSGAEIQDTDATAFENAVPFLTTNRFLLAEFSDELFSPNISQVRTTVWGAPAKPTVRHSFTLDFGNSNNARHFFNSGGTIRFSGSFVGATATPRNLAWTNLLSSMGAVAYGYNGATASSGTGNGIGFYSLTNVAQTVYTKMGTVGYYLYNANDYTITMSCDVANNNTGTARYIYVSVYFNDDSTEVIDGTLTHTVSVRRASGSNVDVAKPNATNTVLLTA
jgi:hypothetical protein